MQIKSVKQNKINPITTLLDYTMGSRKARESQGGYGKGKVNRLAAWRQIK